MPRKFNFMTDLIRSLAIKVRKKIFYLVKSSILHLAFVRGIAAQSQLDENTGEGVFYELIPVGTSS